MEKIGERAEGEVTMVEILLHGCVEVSWGEHNYT